jgi:hypothetical protein
MIVLKGLQGPLTVKGQQFGTAVMQPWDKTLTDEDRRRSYLRSPGMGKQGWPAVGGADFGIAQGTCEPERIVHGSRSEGSSGRR